MILKLFFICLIFGLGWADMVPAKGQKILRPCFLDDYKCIGDNLAANSNCKRQVQGYIPSLYKIPKFKFHTPFFNATYIDNNLKIRNQNNCFVSGFFYNERTDTMVLTIDCPRLNFESTRTYIEHRSFSENVIYNYYINATYPLIRLTTTLSHANRLNLCDSFTFAYVAALPEFYINPYDRRTANYLTKDLTQLNIYERETFFWRGNQLARSFINSLICNFGCYY